MNCKDLKELLSAYVDGELSRTQREFVEEHLAGCADCRAILEGYRAVNQKLTSLREVPAMPDRKGAIISKIKEEHTRKPTQPWLRPALVATVVIAVIAALIGVEFLGVGSSEGTGVMMPPPLSSYIRGYTYTLSLLAGVLMMAGLAFRSKFARKIAGFMSIVFGGIGVYLGLNALLAVTKSDQSLIMGIIPFFGLIAGTVYLKKQVGQRWMAVAGLAFCLAALVLYIIFLVNYHHWFSWLLLAIAIVIPAGVIGYSFHSEITGVSPRWRRLALVAIPIVAILIALTVLQPWSSFPGPQSVMAKAYAATEGLRSYRMSVFFTSTSGGRTFEQNSEWEFAFPNRYHGKITLDNETYEFIIIGEKTYARDPDDASGKLSIGVHSAFAPSKEYTLEILDSLTGLQKLPDERIEGTDCLRYQGRVDVEQKIKELKARLDPEEAGCEERLKGLEALRTTKTEVELWIGKDDFLIRQMKSIMESSVHGNAVVVVKFYDFNEAITIEPPVTASGELLPGWRLQSSSQNQQERTFSSDVSFTISGDDLAHQQISFRIVVTNISDDMVSNMRVSLASMATNEESDWWIWNSPSQVTLKPGESETYHISWEYDASQTSKEELDRLVNLTTILATYTTLEGEQSVELLFPDAPYPSKRPPS